MNHAPVVQWIEWRIPVPQIRVRFPTGVLITACNLLSYMQFYFFNKQPKSKYFTNTQNSLNVSTDLYKLVKNKISALHILHIESFDLNIVPVEKMNGC